MTSIFSSFTFFLFLLSKFKFTVQDSSLVPAIYAFGDSLVDNGNNNYLIFSFVKANVPPYGIDFPGHNATGRFTNGKNVPDFLARKVGLSSPPPYLSLASKNKIVTNTTPFITGVNFASGGAGILDDLAKYFPCQFVTLSQQVEYYLGVYESLVEELGSSAAQEHVSKSLFTIVMGSNDIFAYYALPDIHNKSTPPEYVDSMAATLESHIKNLYNHGARKYVISGVGLIGCTPQQRKDQNSDECKDEMNYWVTKYNFGLKSMLYRLKADLNDIAFTYVDAYELLSDYTRTPSSYGFNEVKAACCGEGRLNAEEFCSNTTSLCLNRNDHLFWDPVHPTQEAVRILVDYIFDGPSKYAYPLNIKELIAV